MIDIDFEDISEWYGAMLEQKYGEKFSVLKKQMYAFYNLADQLSFIYYTMLKSFEGFQFDDQIPQSIKIEQTKAFYAIIDQTLHILAKMVQTKSSPIEKTTCEQFANNFQYNLSILCTEYHALNHCDIIKDKFISERKKIVVGINSLYSFHTRIRDLYKNHFFNELKAISHQKKVINTSKKVIIKKIEALNAKQFQIQSLDKNMVQFYQEFLESLEKIDENSQPLKKIVISYTKILEQFYEAQGELENLMVPLMDYCEELKQKKKGASAFLGDMINMFMRFSSQILKPNYSIKTVKKLKMDEFSKCLTILFEHISGYDDNPLMTPEAKVQQIIQLTNFLIECIKQLEKVESSGMMSSIKEYQEKLYPHDHKKKIAKIIEYKKFMGEYYQVQQLVKKFTASIREMALKEFGVKVNLIINEDLYSSPQNLRKSEKETTSTK